MFVPWKDTVSVRGSKFLKEKKGKKYSRTVGLIIMQINNPNEIIHQ